MNSNYVDLDLILEKIDRMKAPNFEYNPSEVKEWVWEALSKIGAVEQFVQASIEVEIEGGKGKVPTNIHSIDTIVEGSSAYNMDEIYKNDPFRELTYKMNAGYIFTSFEKGSVIFNAHIFPVDENNNPLIPDNQYFISAITSYVEMMMGKRAFFQGKLGGPQFQWLEREWLFYCPAAKNAAMMPSEDQLHDLKRTILKPIPTLYRNNRGTTQGGIRINTPPKY